MELQPITDLEIQLADCDSFKWLGGMKTVCGVRLREGWQLDTWVKAQTEFPPVPDIKDPATRGCLLQIIRDISRDESAYAAEFEEGWCITTWPEQRNPQHYATEGEALAMFIINN